MSGPSQPSAPFICAGIDKESNFIFFPTESIKKWRTFATKKVTDSSPPTVPQDGAKVWQRPIAERRYLALVAISGDDKERGSKPNDRRQCDIYYLYNGNALRFAPAWIGERP